MDRLRWTDSVGINCLAATLRLHDPDERRLGLDRVRADYPSLLDDLFTCLEKARTWEDDAHIPWMIAQLAGEVAVTRLLPFLAERNSAIVWGVCDALRIIGSQEAIPALRSVRVGSGHGGEMTAEAVSGALEAIEALQALRAGPSAWAKWRQPYMCPALNRATLSGLHAPEINLANVWLEATMLSGCDLHGADLSGTHLLTADLCNSNLRGADLTGADLEKTCLRGADLSGAVGLSSRSLSLAFLDGQTVLPAL